ncbi:hypothetical protein F383_33819 [Gossypium arboreum]|nr:hypothetical protein F383_33819 [Gossypium arboreum]
MCYRVRPRLGHWH